MIHTILLLAALAAVPTPTYDRASMPADYWRNPLRCGTNCLYAYLALHDRPATIGAIAARVPIGPKGASMAELRKAATELGLPSQVVKTTPSRLAEYPLPAIAHLQTREGHFILVLRTTPETVTTADMLSGHVELMPADAFSEQWSGYLLVPSSPSHGWLVAMLIGGFATCLAFSRTLIGLIRRRDRGTS